MTNSQLSLGQIHSVIEASYQAVEHISAAQFETLDPKKTLIFDVREPDEYKVSHISNAILLTPDTDPEDFVEDYGVQLKGKQLVFYCSVGRRSSDLLNRLLNDPDASSVLGRAQSAHNLEGGVFAWVNGDRELSDMEQQTTLEVHPFNAFWGQLIEDSARRQY